MSLFSIFDISGSAMSAQSKRLNVSASNMANADSVAGPDGQPYRAKQVVFQVNPSIGTEIGGVQVSDVIESDAPFRLIYDPS
ncbi:flagellar basal body rod protein FlgC, partial [Salmonella enterica subsp. enterica serovar Offa]|nr:flagellar basal body rod protein FlgC [Salmonella enterica subsp. enterica serovar Offa]